MRTTVELPDELLIRAKTGALQSGVSLKEFFIQAIEGKLAQQKAKSRRPPPVIGRANSPVVNDLTREQMDEAMFGS